MINPKILGMMYVRELYWVEQIGEKQMLLIARDIFVYIRMPTLFRT
jgi:hypothetical protein